VERLECIRGTLERRPSSNRAVDALKEIQTGNFPDMQTHNVLGAGFTSSFRWNERKGGGGGGKKEGGAPNKRVF